VIDLAKDLICGMNVDEETCKLTSQYQGKTYFFCSPNCKEDFEKDPSRYID
jgi:YHS domain-containing protein